MRKTIHKLFFFWDFQKEEDWLNDMASIGLALVAVDGARYTFEQSEPGEFGVRLELLNNLPSHPESDQYIRFIESTGAEYIGATLRWVYFRKRKANGPFDLYSDYECRAKHLNRILAMVSPVCFLALVMAANFGRQYLSGENASFTGWIAAFEIAIFALFAFGIVKILLIKRRMKKEHALYE